MEWMVSDTPYPSFERCVNKYSILLISVFIWTIVCVYWARLLTFNAWRVIGCRAPGHDTRGSHYLWLVGFLIKLKWNTLPGISKSYNWFKFCNYLLVEFSWRIARELLFFSTHGIGCCKVNILIIVSDFVVT